jgi:tetratricopeptide (TPR) repeat protein
MSKKNHRRTSQPSRTEAGVARFALGLVLLMGTVVLFWPSTRNGLVYDDEPLIRDSFVQSGLTAGNVWLAFTSIEAAHWHPLTWLSFEMDQAIGFGPRGFHATNVILHAINSWLLYQVLLRSTAAMWRSWFAAALFAVHPLHVESVAWIAERKDVLSTFFWLLALLIYVRYARTPKVSIMLLMAMGLMAKSMLVTLPATLLIFDWWPLARTVASAGNSPGQAVSWWQAVLEKSSLFVLALIGIGIQLWVQRASWKNEPVLPLALRIENAIVVPVIYLRKVFWPSDLAAFYPYPPKLYAPAEVILAGAILLGITILSVRTVRSRPYFLAGWAWYLITLAPVSGIFQVLGGHAYADRYTYVPMIGIFWIVAWGLGDAVRAVVPARATWESASAVSVVAVGAGLWLAALCWLTSRQIPTWHDDRQLWSHAITVRPDNYFALNNLGVALERRSLYDEAIECYERSIALKDNFSGSHNNLGQLLEHRGRFMDAVREYQAAVQHDPDNPQGWINLARQLGKMGNWRDAALAGRHASRLTPNDPAVRVLTGMNLVYVGDFQSARGEFQAAKEIDPKMAQAWYGLGTVQMIDGEDARALDSFSSAASLAPDKGPYAYALAQSLRKLGSIKQANEVFQRARTMDAGWIKMANSLAWNLATNPDNNARNGRYALWLASQICQLVDNQNAACLETLAAAQAEVGDFAAAKATLQRLLAEPEIHSSDQRRKTLESQLQGYERHQPYRLQSGES